MVSILFLITAYGQGQIYSNFLAFIQIFPCLGNTIFTKLKVRCPKTLALYPDSNTYLAQSHSTYVIQSSYISIFVFTVILTNAHFPYEAHFKYFITREKQKSVGHSIVSDSKVQRLNGFHSIENLDMISSSDQKTKKKKKFIAHDLSYNIPKFGREQSTNKLDGAQR